MAGIPKQVEEADRLARQFVAGLKGEQPEGTEDESAEDEEKTEEEEEEEAEEEADTEESDDASEDESDDESEETDSDKEEETWQQRYRTLKGMFDAEVPRLNKELSEMKAQVFERLGQLGQPVQQATPAEKPDETPEEVAAFIEEMGPEYITKLNKYMEYMLKPIVDSSVRPVAEKVDDVEDATLRAAQKQFSDYLDTKVNGDWQDLMAGKDDKFIDFLNSPDPSGLYTNGQLMKLYNDNWDADRLATLLNSYLGESEAEKPEKKKKTPNVQPKRKTPNSQPEEEGEKKIWTQADIKALEKAERDGKLTAEESKAQFADLLAAANEGRIRG